MYAIKEGYKEQPDAKQQDKRGQKDNFQISVYSFAYEVAISRRLHKITDVGCGSGHKLLSWFDDFQTVGYEVDFMVDFLETTYPHKRWVLSNFKSNPEKADVVICADVIEHVKEPDRLLEWIKAMEPEAVILSTPDRDKLNELYGWGQDGPPHNNYHIREWNFDEFGTFAGQYFKIINHRHFDKYQQMIYCR